MVMNLMQSISSERIDEGAARSSSWLTAANMDEGAVRLNIKANRSPICKAKGRVIYLLC